MKPFIDTAKKQLETFGVGVKKVAYKKTQNELVFFCIQNSAVYPITYGQMTSALSSCFNGECTASLAIEAGSFDADFSRVVQELCETKYKHLSTIVKKKHRC